MNRLVLVVALCMTVASAAHSVRFQRHHRCTLHDVDIFTVVNEPSLPLMQHLMQSIRSLIPCYGNLHVVSDEKDMYKLSAWMDTDEMGTKLHTFDDLIPQSLRHIPGYILQAWLMMQADTLVRDSARHIMFVDADMVIGVPVARKLLFDDLDRPYIGFWDFKYQPQFSRSCESFLGNCTVGSSMSFMPFVFPVRALRPMRQHLARKHNAVDFDAAFAKWAHAVGPDMVITFSQFVVMGNYAATFMPDAVAVVECPWQSHVTPESRCATWAPIGVHLGWRYCAYLESCPRNLEDAKLFTSGEPFGIYKKYTASYIEAVQNISFSASCFKHYHYTGKLQRGCTVENSVQVNRELLPYPTLPDRVSKKVASAAKAEFERRG